MNVAPLSISGVIPAASICVSSGWCGCLHFGQFTRTSRWASTAMMLEATRYAGTPMSIIRVIAPGASLVCSVENTRCPVSDAWMPIWAVSVSRISPTRITLGACRSIDRITRAKSRPMECLISTWLMPAR